MNNSIRFSMWMLAVPLVVLLSSCYSPKESGGSSGGQIAATLSELRLDGVVLDQTFQEFEFDYTASVEVSTSQVILTVSQTNSNDTIAVNGSAVNSGSATLDLVVGGNVFTITVSNDFVSQDYTLTITRGGQITATLSELRLDGVVLDQAFQETQLDYTASVGFSTSQVNLNVSPTNSGDTITVNNNAVTGGAVTLDFVVGVNVFNIAVANEFASQTYTLTITRESAPPVSGAASITNIESRSNEVTVTWSDAPNATSYNVYYFSTNSLTALADLNDYIGLPEGTRIANQTSPLIINGLTNNTAYQFYVSAVDSNGDEIVDLNDIKIAVPRPDLGNMKIVAGLVHSLAIRSDGTVIAWGQNANGQLGDNLTATKFNELNLTDVVDIAAGGFHSVALLSNGTVVAWGNNFDGQLGNGSSVGNSSVPVVVSILTDVQAVAAGRIHTLALRSDGTVMAWGRNDNGQLGDGTQGTDRSTPVFVTGLNGVVAIRAGRTHSLALKSDGTVWAWGDNFNGQLGIGSTQDSLVPVQVTGLTGISQIAVGSSHNIALDSSGRVFTWGFNGNGELGINSRTNALTPQEVSVSTEVSAIAAGYFTSFAFSPPGLTSLKGQWFLWGTNVEGQLGLGTEQRALTPRTGGPFADAAQISGGSTHTILLNWDAETSGVGQDDEGQLDFGISATEPVPESRSISLVVVP